MSEEKEIIDEVLNEQAEKNPDKFATIDDKINKLMEMTEEKKQSVGSEDNLKIQELNEKLKILESRISAMVNTGKYPPNNDKDALEQESQEQENAGVIENSEEVKIVKDLKDLHL